MAQGLGNRVVGCRGLMVLWAAWCSTGLDGALQVFIEFILHTALDRIVFPQQSHALGPEECRAPQCRAYFGCNSWFCLIPATVLCSSASRNACTRVPGCSGVLVLPPECA